MFSPKHFPSPENSPKNPPSFEQYLSQSQRPRSLLSRTSLTILCSDDVDVSEDGERGARGDFAGWIVPRVGELLERIKLFLFLASTKRARECTTHKSMKRRMLIPREFVTKEIEIDEWERTRAMVPTVIFFNVRESKRPARSSTFRLRCLQTIVPRRTPHVVPLRELTHRR